MGKIRLIWSIASGAFSGGASIYVYLVAAALVFTAGWTVNGWRLEAGYKDAQLDAMIMISNKREEAEAKNQQLSDELEKARNDRRTVYRTITQQVDKIIERPVYRNECLDADGLRSINSALAGKAEATGQPDKPVPPPDAPFWRRWFGGNP